MFGFSPHCINESTVHRRPLCKASLRVEIGGNSASNLASRAVWKNQISLEGLISAFSTSRRCHHVLKSHKVYLENTITKSAIRRKHMVEYHDTINDNHGNCYIDPRQVIVTDAIHARNQNLFKQLDETIAKR